MNKQLYKELLKMISSDSKGIEKFSKLMMQSHNDDEDYWIHIFEVMEFSNDIIKEYIDEINILYLLKHQKLNDEILLWLDETKNILKNESYVNVLLIHQQVPDKLIRKYLEITPILKVDWVCLAYNQYLEEDIIDKYNDKLDWNIISQDQFLKLKTIAKYHKKINWYLLATNLKTKYLFNDSFVRYFQDMKFWDNIGWMDKVTFDCIIELKHHLSIKSWYSILEHKSLTIDQLEIFISDYLYSEIKLNDQTCWKLISANQTLSKEFIIKYANKLDWNEICMFQVLDWDLINKYNNNISLKILSSNDCLTEELINTIKNNSNLFKDELDEELFELNKD